VVKSQKLLQGALKTLTTPDILKC